MPSVTAERIIDILLSLPCEARVSVLDEINYNRIFCSHCGEGGLAAPNPNCRCSDDE